MPKEGIFARILIGGNVRTGDSVVIERRGPEHA